jgi:hypothetical protein
MKHILLILIALVLVFALVSCAAGPNQMKKTPRPDGKVAGFFHGLWHGFIVLFTFIISLFTDKVGVYEAHNSGGWYNFGFIIGAAIFFGGSGSAGKRTRK